MTGRFPGVRRRAERRFGGRSRVVRPTSVAPMSRFRISAILAAVAIALAACNGEAAEPSTSIPQVAAGTANPADAVTELMAALAAGDYQRAAELTVDDQMVAIAAAEDSSVGALAAVLEDGGTQVAANYWRGFAGNLEELLGVQPGQVSVDQVTPLGVDGVEFARVALDVPVDTAQRRFIVRNGGGWKVDVVATFAPTLASRLGRAAEALRADPSATDVLAALSEQRKSLEAALRSGGLDAETSQLIRSAIVSLGG